MIGIGNDVPMRLRSLLKFLMKLTDRASQSIFWCVIFGMAFALEMSMELQSASTNPLHAPALIGPQGGVKAYSQAQKHTVAVMASQGAAFKSGQAVVKGMLALGRVWLGSAKAANKWINPLALQYLGRVQEIFYFKKIRIPVFSVAWDATRLSSYDALASTIYNAALDLAAWMPPQAAHRQAKPFTTCCCGDAPLVGCIVACMAACRVACMAASH